MWLALLLAVRVGAQTPATAAPEQTACAKLKHAVAVALRTPMKDGLNVDTALTAWFAAEKTTDAAAAEALYRKALESLPDAKPLPQAKWPANPIHVSFTLREELPLRGDNRVRLQIVQFKVDNLRQYGVMLRPRAEGKYPLIVYVHGAAFGVPIYALPWLADIAAQGYVIVGPAFRGEPLFYHAAFPSADAPYKCEGKIENLKGEPRDVLAMADAARRLPYVKAGKYAILGHSFGAGAGLLAAARTDQVAVVISYDAWLVNPFRFYWERLRGGSIYYWESWEEFCKQPVPDQLRGLMERSVVHHAQRIQAPVLLFIGENDAPSYHECHQDLFAALKAAGKTVRHVVAKGGGHNFVLYPESEPARFAAKIQAEWLNRYHPPTPPVTEPAPTALPKPQTPKP